MIGFSSVGCCCNRLTSPARCYTRVSFISKVAARDHHFTQVKNPSSPSFLFLLRCRTAAVNSDRRRVDISSTTFAKTNRNQNQHVQDTHLSVTHCRKNTRVLLGKNHRNVCAENKKNPHYENLHCAAAPNDGAEKKASWVHNYSPFPIKRHRRC